MNNQELRGIVGMKRLLILFMIVLIMISMLPNSIAEQSTEANNGNGKTNINLQEMTIEELLFLQKEIQTVLADKGYVKYEELDRGSKGDSVSKVQERLKELGYYNGNITGKYDTETQKAMKSFEKNNGLNNDGKASQSDLLLLYSSSALPKQTTKLSSTGINNSSKKQEDEPEGYLPFSAFDYTEFFRYPEKYYGTKIVLKGRVIQVLGSRSRGYEIRLATSGNGDVVYIRVKFDPGFNILENDRLTVYAEMKDTYTYITTFLNSVTIPSANADSIKIN